MSGLQQMTGAAMPFEIDGKKYFPKLQITMGMRGEIEAHILSRRPDFMEQISKSLPKFDKQYHKEIIAEAVRRSAMAAYVTNEEFGDYLHTLEGAAILFWMLVRENHPEIDSASAAQAILEKSKLDLSEIQSKLDRAAGLSSLKNSDGPEANNPADGPEADRAEAASPAMGETETKIDRAILNNYGSSELPGQKSTDTSLADADGISIKSAV